MRRLVQCAFVMAALVAFNQPTVLAGTISVTFDESQLATDNNDPLLNFYNGGTTFRGIGPGPNLGVVFVDTNARLFTQAQTGTYTPPGYMVLFNDAAREGEGISTIMNINGGIMSTLFFDYATIDAPGSITIYSGLDGTGTALASKVLAVSSPFNGPGVFVADSLSFSGVGSSIVFKGGNKQLAIDGIVMTSIPEPPTGYLLAVAIAIASLWTRFLRPAKARAAWRDAI
jgi:hypothetical protein